MAVKMAAILITFLCFGTGVVLFQYCTLKRLALMQKMIDLLAKEAAGRVAPGTAYNAIVEE